MMLAAVAVASEVVTISSSLPSSSSSTHPTQHHGLRHLNHHHDHKCHLSARMLAKQWLRTKVQGHAKRLRVLATLSGAVTTKVQKQMQVQHLTEKVKGVWVFLCVPPRGFLL
jgi:hypothetical protein